MDNTKINNPFNIRGGKDAWKGKIGEKDGFVMFQSVAFAIRCMLVLSNTYINKYKIKTIKEFISTYAPPSENDTATYIRNVCTWNGWKPDTEIRKTRGFVCDLIKSIARQENQYKISDTDMAEGLKLFIADNPNFFVE